MSQGVDGGEQRDVEGDGIRHAARPLTIGLIVHHALGMLRLGYLRVAIVALILFVPPATLGVWLEQTTEDRFGAALDGRVLIAIAISALFHLFGPVVFAGYLDEAVGSEYFRGRRHRLPAVLRSLPWLSLLVADLIVVAGTSIGLALFVVPGILFYACSGLVGPVIVQERRGIRRSFVRTLEISRTALIPILLLVVIPLALEQVVHEVVDLVTRPHPVGVRILVGWLVTAFVGGTVGLLEVALATELMARNPTSRD